MDTPILTWSSGELRLDRRYALAKEYFADGDDQAVCDLLEANEPTSWAPWWFLRGKALARLKQSAEAIEAFQRACTCDPQDRLGAALELALLGATKPAQLPPAFVRELFDAYAPRFDQALVDGLEYRAPQLILQALEAVMHQQKRPLYFEETLDLGCGTGLSGEVLRTHTQSLVGCDLSSKMLHLARQKNLYDDLHEGDIIEILQELQASWSLIVAADVFVYFGDLQPVFHQIWQALKPDGLCAFTVQSHEGEGYQILPDRRTAHAQSYIEQALRAANLTCLTLEPVHTRKDQGIWVPGLLCVAQKS